LLSDAALERMRDAKGLEIGADPHRGLKGASPC
jgi:hypothetical protein